MKLNQKTILAIHRAFKEYDKENLKAISDKIKNKTAKEVENTLKTKRIHPANIKGTHDGTFDLPEFFDHFDRKMFHEPFINELPYIPDYFYRQFLAEIMNSIGKAVGTNISAQYRKPFKGAVRQKTDKYVKEIIAELRHEFSIQRTGELLSENPNYNSRRDEIISVSLEYGRLYEKLLNETDVSPAGTYEARKLRRHFVLHIGPTNSGKTHEAVKALEEAKTGVYLAPLRLLAYEQFDRLNKDGILCNLLTGEESIEIPFAEHTASTVEMLDLNRDYEVAVIDEVQMIADRMRGHAWTRAILGAKAENIHLCASPEAEKILVRLIEECGDSYEIHHKERPVPLRYERSMSHDFVKDIRKGDAYIVFSRKDVHTVAAELKEKGVRYSIIYGNLPYDVRHEEARKFSEGESDVLVATDAIGMGLNLPIKRIVFIRQSKFDGVSLRELTRGEIRQIAGRAGRYGIYDEGLYTSLEDDDYFERAVTGPLPDITSAVISFPEGLLDLNFDLSLIMRKWEDGLTRHGYTKSDLSEEIVMCSIIEKKTADKKLIYDLVSMPVELKSKRCMEVWETAADMVIEGRAKELMALLPERTGTVMAALEEDYKVCDILYNMVRRFAPSKEDLETIMDKKRQISSELNTLIEKQAVERKTCRMCGKPLKWSYSYGICGKCYNSTKEFDWW